MPDILNNDLISLPETIGVVSGPIDSVKTIQPSSLLEPGEQTQDYTKPYRIAFKGKLTNGERPGD